MKLYEFSDTETTVIAEGDDYYMVVEENQQLDERKISLVPQTNEKGGTLGKLAKGALSFAKNPVVAGLSIGYAIDALEKYKKNKSSGKSKEKIYARDRKEEQFYREMINKMTKSGDWELVSSKNVPGGGHVWEVKKKR